MGGSFFRGEVPASTRLAVVRQIMAVQWNEELVAKSDAGRQLRFLSCCDLEATGRDCLRQKEADRLSHQTYPTRQSGEVTDRSGTLGQCIPHSSEWHRNREATVHLLASRR